MRMSKKDRRSVRHRRIRKSVFGVPERQRLCVFKSPRHVYAQVIDDVSGCVSVSCSSLCPEFREKMDYGGNVKAANLVGKMLAERCVEKGIKKVVFDRGGNPYHGRVKAIAEACRKGGIQF